MKIPHIYLISGEPSGDLLGSYLMNSLRSLTNNQIRFSGIGGIKMKEAGLLCLFSQEDLAVMGFLEVVPRLPKIFKRLRETLQDITVKKPDIIVTIDSWGFSQQIAKSLKKKKMTIPHIHYVAPMVWAWKEKRAKKIAQLVDKLLCLLPHEPRYFIKEGLPSIYVGHPLMDRKIGNGSDFRKKFNIASHQKILSLLPGSRKMEISRLLPIFYETLQLLKKDIPDLQIVIPVIDYLEDFVDTYVKNWSFKPIIISQEVDKIDLFAASQIALAASGTVALELAIAKVPMIIAYRISPLSAFFARLFLKIRYISLVNILLNQPIIPEFLQDQCKAKILYPELVHLLFNNEARQKQFDAMDRVKSLLTVDENYSRERAAQEILTML